MQCSAAHADRESLPAVLRRVGEWCLTEMTALNQAVLDGRRPWPDFARAFSEQVLPQLPPAAAFSPIQAQQAVVLLGLAGASLGRHYQEADESHRATPEQAFAGITAGPDREPFTAYYGALADRTGTGHGPRDSYASLIRWNLPPAEVVLNGVPLALLPSSFGDGLTRTYTGTTDETRFFGLLKASEVLERAVNRELLPLSDGSVDLAEPSARKRIDRAVLLLDALRDLNHGFAARPVGEGLRVNYFMDVFRQYAVHWRPGDVPPSGALDAESLIRDLVVGIAMPEYPARLQRVYPGLLDDERRMLSKLMNRDSLPQAALHRAGVSGEQLTTLSVPELTELVSRHPVLLALHRLLNAHARVAGGHLRLSKLFLFAPQAARDREGYGDPGVVSNRSGTTGMDESWLEHLTRVRNHHVLRPLRVITVGTAGHPATAGGPTRPVVRFIGSRLAQADLGVPGPPVGATGASGGSGAGPAVFPQRSDNG